MTKPSPPPFGVFISSSTFLTEERQQVYNICMQMNAIKGKSRPDLFRVIRCDDPNNGTAYPINKNPNDVIQEQHGGVCDCDIIFVIVDGDIGEGTHGEVLEAIECYEKTKNSSYAHPEIIFLQKKGAGQDAPSPNIKEKYPSQPGFPLFYQHPDELAYWVRTTCNRYISKYCDISSRHQPGSSLAHPDFQETGELINQLPESLDIKTLFPYAQNTPPPEPWTGNIYADLQTLSDMGNIKICTKDEKLEYNSIYFFIACITWRLRIPGPLSSDRREDPDHWESCKKSCEDWLRRHLPPDTNLRSVLNAAGMVLNHGKLEIFLPDRTLNDASSAGKDTAPLKATFRVPGRSLVWSRKINVRLSQTDCARGVLDAVRIFRDESKITIPENFVISIFMPQRWICNATPEEFLLQGRDKDASTEHLGVCFPVIIRLLDRTTLSGTRGYTSSDQRRLIAIRNWQNRAKAGSRSFSHYTIGHHESGEALKTPAGLSAGLAVFETVPDEKSPQPRRIAAAISGGLDFAIWEVPKPGRTALTTGIAEAIGKPLAEAFCDGEAVAVGGGEIAIACKSRKLRNSEVQPRFSLLWDDPHDPCNPLPVDQLTEVQP